MTCCEKWKELTDQVYFIRPDGNVALTWGGEAFVNRIVDAKKFIYCPYCRQRLDGRIPCHYCNEDFNDIAILNSHMNQHHSVQLD